MGSVRTGSHDRISPMDHLSEKMSLSSLQWTILLAILVYIVPDIGFFPYGTYLGGTLLCWLSYGLTGWSCPTHWSLYGFIGSIINRVDLRYFLPIWILDFPVKWFISLAFILLQSPIMHLSSSRLKYLKWLSTIYLLLAIFDDLVMMILWGIFGGSLLKLSPLIAILFKIRYLQVYSQLIEEGKITESAITEQPLQSPSYQHVKEIPKPQQPEVVHTTTHDSIPVTVKSGYDVAGEQMKLGVKVMNEGNLSITNVRINLDIPDGFEFVKGTLPSQKIGNISPGGFQSAIFWLKPVRCVNDEYGGSVVFRDARGKTRTIEIPRKEIVNVCPMLEETDDVTSVFRKLKFGNMPRNCASFEFSGNALTVFELSKARLRGLDSVDESEQETDDGSFLGYACYVGQTKYGDKQFAAEIQTTGGSGSGVLTLTVYSEDKRILSGFMVDVMQDVREHVQVLEEKSCPLATCPKCGADLDIDRIDEGRVYICPYCNAASKIAPWLA